MTDSCDDRSSTSEITDGARIAELEKKVCWLEVGYQMKCADTTKKIKLIEIAVKKVIETVERAVPAASAASTVASETSELLEKVASTATAASTAALASAFAVKSTSEAASALLEVLKEESETLRPPKWSITFRQMMTACTAAAEIE